VVRVSKADKMFEELGYTVEEGKSNVYIYINDCEYVDYIFVIHKKSKSISIYKTLIKIEELQAINEKVKELEEMELDNNDIFDKIRNYAELILKGIKRSKLWKK
jgi:hypothetical protein